MPIVRCRENGKDGWKVENANKCFTGPGAKEKARKQLAAIEISKKERGKSEELQAAKKYSHIDFKPTEAMANAAKSGLEIRERQPDSNKCCTQTGLARARQISNRQTLSPSTVRRMKAFFDRHSAFTDKHKDKNSKAWQSWQIWGGNPGRSWANARVKQMDAADKKANAEVIKWTKYKHGHIHSWRSSDLETTYVNGHSHKVINGVVQPDPDDGHTHDWFIPNTEDPGDGKSPQDKHRDPNKKVFEARE